MDNQWLVSALWIGLALVSSLVSIRIGLSVAMVEIVVGAVGGNLVALPITPWVNYLAGVGAILLTFLAGAEVDPIVVRKHFAASMSIGVMGFFAPFFGVLAYAHYLSGWPWPQAEIAAIALSTTSVAVVFAVMLETGYNRTELGKIILAACFINDLGTVLALGVLFANYNGWLALFAAVTALASRCTDLGMVRRLVEQHGVEFKRVAEDMRQHVAKHDALQRDLMSAREKDAPLRGLMLLAGARRL